ncbi:MAG TPA: hypothetical protein VF603_09170 [Allosphingosinicella sp.]
MAERMGAEDSETPRLRRSARRLAAELHRAGLYGAAAYAAMAADAIDDAHGEGSNRSEDDQGADGDNHE